MPCGQLGQDRVGGLESGPVVIRAEHPGELAEQPRRARSPGGRADHRDRPRPGPGEAPAGPIPELAPAAAAGPAPEAAPGGRAPEMVPGDAARVPGEFRARGRRGPRRGHPQRAGAVGGQRGAPDEAVRGDPVGRIPAAAGVHAQGPRQVQQERGAPLQRAVRIAGHGRRQAPRATGHGPAGLPHHRPLPAADSQHHRLPAAGFPRHRPRPAAGFRQRPLPPARRPSGSPPQDRPRSGVGGEADAGQAQRLARPDPHPGPQLVSRVRRGPRPRAPRRPAPRPRRPPSRGRSRCR